MRRPVTARLARSRRPLVLVPTLAMAFGWLLIGSPAALADGPTAFSNTTAIAIPATGSADQMGPASP